MAPTAPRPSAATAATIPSTRAAATTRSTADQGNDTLNGGDGNDTIESNSGDDTIDAGAGDDTIRLQSGSGGTTLQGGAGADSLAASNATLGSFNASTASIEIIRGLFGGNYAISGTSGANTLDFRGATVLDTLQVNAGDGSDTLFGSDGAETLRGDGGDDTINAQDGNDTIDGGAGNDTLNGGEGNDTIEELVRQRHHQRRRRERYDPAAVRRRRHDDTGRDRERHAGDLERDACLVQCLERPRSRPFARCSAAATRSTAPRPRTRSTCAAQPSLDSLFVNAGDGNDTLFGSTAAETLRGDGGNDSINSGAGNDTVTRGSGADTFVYRAGHGADTATDFRRTDGDKIDLAGVAGITSFAALQAKITQSSPNTVIDFGNGDTLTLTGVNATSLLASDFIIAGAGGNIIPTAVTLVNATSAIAENTSTATRVKIADITVTDDVLGTNTLGLTGADAASFEIVGTSLFLKAGTALNFETKQSYAVAVTVDDTAVGTTPDAVSATFALSITDVNEAPTVLSLAGNSIAENSAPGTTVGRCLSWTRTRKARRPTP